MPSHATHTNSKVRLTSFVLYRLNAQAQGPVEILAGASVARFTPETRKVQFVADHAPFRSPEFAQVAPRAGHGLLALYGNRERTEELSYWRQRARALKAEFAYVSFEVEVGRILPGGLDSQLLQAGSDIGLLRMQSARVSLQREVTERFGAYVVADGGDPATMANLADMARRPDLFDRLFDEQKALRHVRVAVIPIADDLSATTTRSVAYIRHGAKIGSLVQGSDHVEVLLPDWLTNEATAKKLRATTC